ncbi:MAG TPA: PKD domain-containing protein [Candidatus Thermoplasmatota archaeon]|nr:PKD domain-containing protein [Candidatus Thermoplasmatota archaeon]
MKALLLAGLVVLGALSVAVAVPRGELAGLLDLSAERIPAPPEVRLLSPLPGEGVGHVVRLTGEASSASRAVVDVQYRIDGERWTSIPDVARGQRSTPFAMTLTLAPGDHVLEVRAWDGDAYSLAARALVRRDAPTVRIVSPADGEGVAAGTVVVHGVVAGAASGVVVEAGGTSVNATLARGTWTATLTLPDGVHEIRATALAPVPSLPARAVVAAAARAPPTLVVSTPREGAAYGESGDPACPGGCILFAGSSRNAARVDVAVDGFPAGEATLLPTGAWSYRLPILRVSTGVHVATFTADGGVPRHVTFLARTPTALEVRGDLDPRPSHTTLQLEAAGPGADAAEWSLRGETVARGGRVALTLPTHGDHAVEVRTPLPDGRAATATVPLHALNRAPFVALAEPALVGTAIRLSASASDPDGRIVAYQWELGDGATATTSAPTLTHRYGSRGLFTANVTAVDDAGATARASTLVVVANLPPLADFAWEPAEPSILDVVTLTDTSEDLDGALAWRTWTLGDNATRDEERVAHRFATRGPHAVTLSVLDDLGATTSVTKVVHVRNLPPEPLFSWEPAVPRVHEEVLFMDNSTDLDGPLARRTWRFDDGREVIGPGALHTFRAPGLYNVTLSVVDDLGASANITLPIRVVDSEPRVAAVLHEPERPVAKEEVRFRVLAADREGSIVALSWDFGDGTTSTLSEPAHRYAKRGTYAGSVTVYDEAGLSTLFPFLVEVANALPTSTLAIARGGYAALPTTLVANASDPDGRVVLYRFDADGDGAADCETTEPTCLFTYEEARPHLARVWVEDDDGGIFEAQRLVDVLAPPSHLAPPSVRIESPAPHATMRGDHLVRGEAKGVRPIAKVEMQFRNDTWSYSGSADPWRRANGGLSWSSLVDTRGLADGAYELVVRATDEGGGVGYARAAVWVLNGARPSEVTLQLLAPPDEISEDATVRA